MKLSSPVNKINQPNFQWSKQIKPLYQLKSYDADGCMDNICNMLIRPPRFLYQEKLLIPVNKNKQYILKYEIHHIGFPLSIYSPSGQINYMILYLHGNSSSRYEGFLQIANLPQGVGLACFDFAGCGIRQQTNFITLGKNQSKDVDHAVLYLKQLGHKVVGWGRSMGSVSLLLSKQCDIIIADSPFASLNDLCKQVSMKAVPKACCCFVHILFPCLFCFVRQNIKFRTEMDPNQLQIIEFVEKLNQDKSVLLMAGKKDQMIHYTHTCKLYDKLKCHHKRKILFDGTHNSNRKNQVINQCYSFIDEAIQKYVKKKEQYKEFIKAQKIEQIPLKFQSYIYKFQNLKTNFDSSEIKDISKELKKNQKYQLSALEQIQSKRDQFQDSEQKIKQPIMKNEGESASQLFIQKQQGQKLVKDHQLSS